MSRGRVNFHKNAWAKGLDRVDTKKERKIGQSYRE